MHEIDTQLADPQLSRPEARRGAAPTEPGSALAAGRTDVIGAAGLMRLQRQVGNAGTLQLLSPDSDQESPEQGRSPVHDVINSAGEPLDSATRADMQATMGQDFSDVRVHRDSAAHDSALSVSAKAYTVGSHVVFQRDAFDPSSQEGRHTLVHELSHVVQQRSGPVSGTPGPGGVRISDPSDSFEREASAIADAALSVSGPAPSDSQTGAGRVVAREPEDDELQTYVQRDAAADLDEEQNLE